MTNINFITIAAGNFTLGDPSLSYGSQLVDIEEFEMSVTEVTVAQYRQCVASQTAKLRQVTTAVTPIGWVVVTTRSAEKITL